MNGMPMGLADPATLSAFRLDKYEVTVGRFRRFVSAWNHGAGYVPPVGSGKHSHLNAGLGLANSGPRGPTSLGGTHRTTSESRPRTTTLDCAARTRRGRRPLPRRKICCYQLRQLVKRMHSASGTVVFWPVRQSGSMRPAGGSEQRQFPWAGPARNRRSIRDLRLLLPSGRGQLQRSNGARERGTSRRWERRVWAPDCGARSISPELWEWNQDFIPTMPRSSFHVRIAPI